MSPPDRPRDGNQLAKLVVDCAQGGSDALGEAASS